MSKNFRHYAEGPAPSVKIKSGKKDYHFSFKSQLLNQLNKRPTKKLHFVSRKDLTMGLFNQPYNIPSTINKTSVYWQLYVRRLIINNCLSDNLVTIPRILSRLNHQNFHFGSLVSIYV